MNSASLRVVRSTLLPALFGFALLVATVAATAGFAFAVGSSFSATQTTANVVASSIPSVTFSGGVNEVKASQTLTVATVPGANKSITIGTCVVTFKNPSDETNCSNNVATINQHSTTQSNVAASLRTLTNVSDATHGTLAVGGSGTTASFTTSGTETSATNINYVNSGPGGVGTDITDVAVTGVIGVKASATVTITGGLVANATDHSVTIDGVAIDLGTGALSTNGVAAAIAANGFAGKNYTVTNPSGANLTFTKNSTGVAGNGALTIQDASYGATAQVIDFTPTLPTVGQVFRATINGTNYDYTVAAPATVADVVSALATTMDADPAVSCSQDGTKVTCTASTAGTAFTYAAELILSSQTISVGTPAPGSAAYGASFGVAATGGASGNPVVITTSGSCSGGASDAATVTMTSGSGTCTVHYNQAGNGGYNAATEVTEDVTATKAETTTTITNDLSAPTVVGEPYTVAYSVTSDVGTPTGTVTVTGGSGCSADLPITQCDVTSTTAEGKNLVASYDGDDNFAASESSSAPHTVSKASTSISITNAGELATPSYAGYPYTVKWSVPVTAPGAGTPTGDVTVSGGSGCTAPVADGQCDVTSTDVGDKSLTASYAGDDNFNGSETAEGTPHTVLDPTITLHIIKNVQNHSIEGFTKSASDFTINVTGVSPSNTGFPGSETGTDVTIQPGAYNIDEADNLGYAESLSEGCSGTLSPAQGGSEGVTCTIANSDFPLTQSALTITKSVTNDNGGTAEAASFTLKVNGEAVTGGAANILAPDTYTVSEDSKEGYTQVSIGGDCAADGTITLFAGQAYHCTITNDDNAPSLTLQKVVDNSEHGGTAVASDWTLSASSTLDADFGISGAGGVASTTFQAGTYTLSETGGPSGYTAGSWSCTNGVTVGEGNHITLGLGVSTTCTITNTSQPATLTIVKHALGDNGTFQFHVSGTASNPSIGTSDGVGSTDPISLNAGTHNVTEDAQNGWVYGGVSCEYNGESVGNPIAGGEEITVDPGDTVVCTFTNERGIGITGTKWDDANGDGSLGQGEAGVADWTITATPITDEGGGVDTEGSRIATTTTTDANGNYHFTFKSPNFGWWRISEATQDGWVRTSEAVTYDVNVSDETGLGALANKNFGNWDEPHIVVTKWNDTNNNGVRDQGEQGISGVTIGLGEVTGETTDAINVEMLQLSLTGGDGTATFNVRGPGHYVVLEENQSGWRVTSPAAAEHKPLIISRADGVATTPNFRTDSFFDVFVEVDGGTINRGSPGTGQTEPPLTTVPLTFGNSTTKTVTTGEESTTTTSTDAGDVTVDIPASTVVTGPLDWDGTIAAPTVTTVTLPNPSGETRTLSTAIELGFASAKLSFDKGVRILLPGQAGKRVGYVRPGIDFTEITSTCTPDDSQSTGNALAPDGDCKIVSSSDLVVWTKHFTTFLTYTQTTNLGGGGGGGSGGGGGGAAAVSRAGDINGDGHVDLLDFNMLMVYWGTNSTGLTVDINHDGHVDLLDFNLLISNWTN